MRPLLLAALAAAALSACGKAEPKAPTPEEVGAELSTFRSVFVPISSETWKSMEVAQKRDPNAIIRPNQYPDPYAHGAVLVGGREAVVSVAYTSVLLAPSPVPLESMSVTQYLRAFEYDARSELARVIAPKGSLFIARDALPRVAAAARAAGAPTDDAPFSVVRGAGR